MKYPSEFAKYIQRQLPQHATIAIFGSENDNTYFESIGHRVVVMNSAALSSVTAIYSRFGFDCFTKQEVVQNLLHLYRLLQPGGVAYIGFTAPDDKKHGVTQLEFLKSNAEEIEPNVFRNADGTQARYTERQLREMLETAGITKYAIKKYVDNLTAENTKKMDENDTILMNVVEIKA